ncbi:PrgH/EprH family type III secretion apparatus protein [Candidatus Williamhamiltonella defendens]|uniref:PrgH/EprH family type III secretion apparatus protein n=1 Tax=Candidatus Williamhamiltonella defendens TaxID=138072 RepID=UPI00130D75BC|nr:PrgH/EprH family type III secretion apparatus protein [Candidatus Hamiltonella defensa]
MGNILFVVGKEEAILKKENEAKLPENTIFILFDVEEFQFEIEVDSSNKILLQEFIHHASK